MATTYYYGKDKAGNPVYESSSPSAAVNKTAAVAAPYSTSSGQSTALTGQSAQTAISAGYNSPIAVQQLMNPVTPAVITPPVTPVNTVNQALTAVQGQTASAVQTPAEQQYLSTVQDLMGSKQDSAQLYADTYGIDQSQAAARYQKDQRDVQNYTAQINDITQKAQADILRTQGQGRGVPEVIIGGQQAQIQKEAAIASLPIAALLANAQGDLALAQQHLDNLFKLRMEDNAANLQNKLNAAKAVYDVASKAEQRQLDAFATQQKFESAIVADTIGRAAELTTFATQNGRPDLAAALAKLDHNSPTYVQDVNKLAAQMPPDILRNAQIAKIRADMNSAGVSGMSPLDLIAYAQQYASNGLIPTGLPKGSFGIVAQYAKELPKASGEIVDNNTNIKSGKLSPTQVDAYGALRDLSIKLNDAEAMFKQLNTGVIGGTLGNIFPTQTRQQYNTLRGEIVDLLARARTGAAINASEEKMYLDKIPGTFNQSFFLGTSGETKLKGLQSSIEGKLDAGLRANGVSMVGFSKVKLGGKQYTVGDTITVNGVSGRVLPDGSISVISQ